MPKRIQTSGRKIVLSVHNFCEKEKANKGPLIPFENVRQRVSGHDGCNYCFIYSNQSLQNTFKGEADRFNGITVDSSKEKCEPPEFNKKVDESLHRWISEGRRCIWFKVHIKDSLYVPILANKGFTFHHAKDDTVIMYKWLPTDSEPNLPPASHTNLGVGAIVFNKKNQLLAISEKHYNYPHWKLPGGYVERGEDIIQAAVREVKEETGVEATFQSLITFRHTHNMMFGNSDMYVLLMMTALSDVINISQREVKDCKWMDIEEYTNHPNVHEFNRMVINNALQYKQRNIKLDLQKKRVTWPTHSRDICFLVVENFDQKS